MTVSEDPALRPGSASQFGLAAEAHPGLSGFSLLSQAREAFIVPHGGETDEATTTWWVFHAMSSTMHPPLYAEIEHEVAIEARTARVHIRGLLHSEGRPIVSPVNGAPHRVLLDMPEGIEFALAEIGSATTSATGAVALDFRTATPSSTSSVSTATGWRATDQMPDIHQGPRPADAALSRLLRRDRTTVLAILAAVAAKA